jgi:hypothetical protein
LTPVFLRALLTQDVTPPFSERERLVALLAALEDPPRAAALAPDDPILVAVARHHRLSPLLSATCGETLPTPLAETFRRDRLVTAARNMILGQVAEECLGMLAGAGIRTIVLKGLDYEARLYRVAGARPTADVDLLVPNEKRREAFSVLDRLGFEPRAAAPGFDDSDYHEVAWTRRGVEVDLHMALAPFARCRIDYAAVWAKAAGSRVGQTDALVLAPTHAAIFQALHMAIDHFDVPAIYLIDLEQLLAAGGDLIGTEAVAWGWHCHGPLSTALGLARFFLPSSAHLGPKAEPSARARRVIDSYGSTAPLPRSEQLFRKLAHFDTTFDAFHYVLTQSWRNIREQIERRVRHRSVRERLMLPARSDQRSDPERAGPSAEMR